MGCNDGRSFIQRGPEPVGLADGLVFPDQTELKADMAEQRELALGQRAVERSVLHIGWIELLRVRQDFHEDGTGIGASMDFIDRVPPLRVDRDAGQEFVRDRPARSSAHSHC